MAILSEQRSRAALARLLAEHGDAWTALSRLQPLRGPLLVNNLLHLCAQSAVALLVQDSPEYPARLGSIPDPPLILHYQGNTELLNRPAIAIVGTRRASAYGLQFAQQLAADLAARGAVIVSGLALGIDSAAHRGALISQGATVGVLGSGLERIAPVSNLGLARRILEAGGGLLSEYPLARSALPHHFPERNRLISGLSAGVIVVEASLRSGSLITARCALEQGREVMAVPGAAGLNGNAGCHRLLRQGAALVESAADVFDALGLISDQIPERFEDGIRAALSRNAQRILELLGPGPLDTDQLGARLNLATQEIAVAITELELEGFVARSGEGYIRRPS
ncbi:MAG: DNA-processing protein DprA [Pseudomonadales bacterium]|nr:DNA-processing protein DprA [Pseudomonadales bacterium]